MPFVVPAPGGIVVGLESFQLGGLELNDRVTFYIREGEVDMAPPKQRPEWIGAADSEWQSLVRNPLHENRVVVLPLQIAAATTKDSVLNRIGQLQDMLATCSQDEDGIALVWSPAGSARTITFDVLSGEITEMPLDRLFSVINRPKVTVTLTCKPYWRGTETLGSTASTSTPFVTQTISNSTGEVPGLGRLIVTDTASQSRRHVEWGLEGPLTYNAATSLLIDSDDMVTSGFAGAQSTQSGAYDPNASGNTVVNAALYTTPVAVCGTGNLAHVGVFRVKARVYSSAAIHRFSWQAGDGPSTANAWVAGYPQPAAWREIDLGTISIPAGSGKWTGRVEAYAPANGTYQTNVDYLTLVPVSAGYGKARATYSYKPGVRVAYDDFTGTTAGSNLNARVAPAGGTWATSGATTDFQFADALFSYNSETVTRATAADASRRFAILGSTSYIDTEVSANAFWVGSASAASWQEGLIARWVDSSNYLAAYYAVSEVTSGIPALSLVVEQIVAGVTTTLGTVALSSSGGFSPVGLSLRLLAFASGTFFAQAIRNDVVSGTATGSSSTLATGGALATGKPGILDQAIANGVARYYDDITVATPVAEPIAIYSGRNLQITDTDTIRQDSGGVYTGRPQSYRGSRFLVPVGTSRVIAKARRNDIDTSTDDNVTDATQIQVGVTPRGLVVPRA